MEKLDVKRFKRTLQADVSVVSSLPSTHLMSRQTIENKIPYEAVIQLQNSRSRILVIEQTTLCIPMYMR